MQMNFVTLSNSHISLTLLRQLLDILDSFPNLRRLRIGPDFYCSGSSILHDYDDCLYFTDINDPKVFELVVRSIKFRCMHLTICCHNYHFPFYGDSSVKWILSTLFQKRGLEEITIWATFRMEIKLSPESIDALFTLISKQSEQLRHLELLGMVIEDTTLIRIIESLLEITTFQSFR